jgi:restriction system protein
VTPENLPRYSDFILPIIKAVGALGGSAQASEVVDRVLADFNPTDEMMAVTYPNRPHHPVLVDRILWGRSCAKLIGALESPKTGVFLITALGKHLLSLPEEQGRQQVLKLDREYRRNRKKKGPKVSAVSGSASTATDTNEPSTDADFDDEPTISPGESIAFQDALLERLHKLSPGGFEEFVLYLLRLYGMELERVGGTGDEGIDGIGTAPISLVLSSRVAVQVKRYEPNGKPVGREAVALFQNDARTKGAERAVLVTLARFTEPARKAATAATPTVDLIDGTRLTKLVLDQQLGIKTEPQLDPNWFDRFE